MNPEYDNGRWAYTCLAELSDNPYDPDKQQPEFEAWKEGWVDEAADDYLAD